MSDHRKQHPAIHTEKRDTFTQAVQAGFEDRKQCGLLWAEQLYRGPWWLRLAWRIGWLVAWPGSTPRTAKKGAR